MRSFGRCYRKRLYFLALVLFTFFAVMTVPVAAQYLPIPPNSPSIHQVVQGNSQVQSDAAILAQRLNAQGSLQLANGQPSPYLTKRVSLDLNYPPMHQPYKLTKNIRGLWV